MQHKPKAELLVRLQEVTEQPKAVAVRSDEAGCVIASEALNQELY